MNNYEVVTVNIFYWKLATNCRFVVMNRIRNFYECFSIPKVTLVIWMPFTSDIFSQGIQTNSNGTQAYSKKVKKKNRTFKRCNKANRRNEEGKVKYCPVPLAHYMTKREGKECPILVLISLWPSTQVFYFLFTYIGNEWTWSIHFYCAFYIVWIWKVHTQN